MFAFSLKVFIWQSGDECVVNWNMQLCGKGTEQLSFENSVYLPIVIFYDNLVKQEIGHIT